MCRICVSLGLVRSIPESRFLVLFLACVFSLNPIFELLLGRGHTKRIYIYIYTHVGIFILTYMVSRTWALPGHDCEITDPI